MKIVTKSQIVTKFCIHSTHGGCKNFQQFGHLSLNSPISQRYFPWQWAVRTPQISSWVITTHCRLYSNISQILLLYKTWQYYIKFDYEIIGGTLLMCQNTTMGVNGASIIRYSIYVQKHITPCTVASVITSLLVHDKLLGTPTSVKWVYYYKTPFPLDFWQQVCQYLLVQCIPSIRTFA